MSCIQHGPVPGVAPGRLACLNAVYAYLSTHQPWEALVNPAMTNRLQPARAARRLPGCYPVLLWITSAAMAAPFTSMRPTWRANDRAQFQPARYGAATNMQYTRWASRADPAVLMGRCRPWTAPRAALAFGACQRGDVCRGQPGRSAPGDGRNLSPAPPVRERFTAYGDGRRQPVCGGAGGTILHFDGAHSASANRAARCRVMRARAGPGWAACRAAARRMHLPWASRGTILHYDGRRWS